MITDLPRNNFKHAIKTGKTQIGMWLSTCSPVVTEAVSGAGLDWLAIDMEHSANEIGDVLNHLRAANGGTAEPVVRIPWNDPVLVKRLLDIGTRTLLFPFVQSAEEARKAVAATLYPPHGIRGVSGTTRANRFGRTPDYFKRAEDEICVLVQCETQLAASRIDEIAAVEGVDGVFIGPADMSADIGFPNDWDRPEVWPTIIETGKRIRKAGKAAGFLSGKESDCRKVIEAGFNFVAVGSDLVTIARAADNLAKIYANAKT